MEHLQIRLEGEHAEETADAFCRAYRELFGVAPSPASTAQTHPPAGNHRSLELALGVAGVLLALPGALNDYADLAERLEIGDKLKRLQALLAGERRTRGTTARLVSLEGQVYDFDRLEPEELMDLFSKKP